MQDMVIEELAPIVTIQAQQGEGQVGFHVAQGFQRARLPASPHGAHFHPGGGVIDSVHHPDKLPGGAAAAQRHRVDLQPSGQALFPHTAPDGYLVPQ